MVVVRYQKYTQLAARGKYRKLYRYLCSLGRNEWRTSFREIESIIGFELPASARLYRPWWGNQKSGDGHSQALAWTMAEWETAEVDLESETLLLRRRAVERPRKFSLDDLWPVYSAGGWPRGLSLSREEMYEERV